MGEAVFIIGLIVGLVMPFILLTGIGRRYWLICMATIGGVVGGMEILSKLTSGKTISAHYWTWSILHESTSWIVIGILAIGWINLLVHLQWKVLKRRFSKT